jgi:hypothetical protein
VDFFEAPRQFVTTLLQRGVADVERLEALR